MSLTTFKEQARGRTRGRMWHFGHYGQTLASWQPRSQKITHQCFRYYMTIMWNEIFSPDWCWILTAVSPHRADIPSHAICWFRESCSAFAVKPSSTLPTGDRQTWKKERIMALEAPRQREKSRKKKNHSQPPSERHQRHLASTITALQKYQGKRSSYLTHWKHTERTEKRE